MADEARDDRPVIRVGVTLESEVEPDSVRILILVEGSFATREECAADHVRETALVASALEPFGLEGDLKSSGYACMQRRSRKKRELEGFDYYDRLTIELARKSHDVSAIMEAIESCGSKASAGVRFFLANEHAEEERLAALAVERSRESAERLASAAGARVLGVKSISYNSYTSAVDGAARFVGASPGTMDEDSRTYFDPEPVEIEARIEAEWWLEADGSGEEIV